MSQRCLDALGQASENVVKEQLKDAFIKVWYLGKPYTLKKPNQPKQQQQKTPDQKKTQTRTSHSQEYFMRCTV